MYYIEMNAEQGVPLRLVTVDPRAFAIHKQFVGSVERVRPIKAKKDLEQAEMVTLLLSTELTHLPISEGIRRLFPNKYPPAAV